MSYRQAGHETLSASSELDGALFETTVRWQRQSPTAATLAITLEVKRDKVIARHGFWWGHLLSVTLLRKSAKELSGSIAIDTQRTRLSRQQGLPHIGWAELDLPARPVIAIQHYRAALKPESRSFVLARVLVGALSDQLRPDRAVARARFALEVAHDSCKSRTWSGDSVPTVPAGFVVVLPRVGPGLALRVAAALHETLDAPLIPEDALTALD